MEQEEKKKCDGIDCFHHVGGQCKTATEAFDAWERENKHLCSCMPPFANPHCEFHHHPERMRLMFKFINSGLLSQEKDRCICSKDIYTKSCPIHGSLFTASPEEAREKHKNWCEYSNGSCKCNRAPSDWKEKEREAFWENCLKSDPNDIQIADYWLSRIEILIESAREEEMLGGLTRSQWRRVKVAHKAEVEEARQEEREKTIKICRDIHLASINWPKYGITEEEAGLDFDKSVALSIIDREEK